jgi:hypothetical protein
MTLAEDFSRVWMEAAGDIRLNKRIVRLLIEEVIVTTTDGSTPQIELVLHWKGGNIPSS